MNSVYRAAIFAVFALFFTSSPVFADNLLFKNEDSGLCLDGYKRGADVNAARCRTAFKAQRWTFDPSSQQIKHTSRNLCLAVSNSNRQNGARLVLWPCGGGLNQKWQISKGGAMRSVMNSKCIDLSKSSNKNPKSGRVHMWDCHSSDNQKWEHVQVRQSFKKK